MAVTQKIDIKIDLKGLEKKLSPTSLKRAQYNVATQAEIDLRKHVPRKHGDLRAHVSITSDGVIAWNALYARAQFYGTNGKAIFRNYTTPGTGKRWDLQKKNYIDRWKRVYTRGLGIDK